MCAPEAPFLSLCASATQGQVDYVNLEKKFTEHLYNLSPEQIILKNKIKNGKGGKQGKGINDGENNGGVHLYTFSEMEKIEWMGLFRCYRPMKLIVPTFYAGLYAEHISKLVAVFEAYDFEFKNEITNTFQV